MDVPKRLIAIALLALCGCVTTDGLLLPGESNAAPTSLVATWNSRVIYAPDPARSGMPAPGLAGRMYLFDADAKTSMAADGAITVDLYDDTPVNGHAASTPIEQWHFDPATLQRLMKKDTFGWGYTLFLPWGTYRPDIKTVHVNVRYEPAHGMPMYAPSGTLTLEHCPPPAGAVR